MPPFPPESADFSRTPIQAIVFKHRDERLLALRNSFLRDGDRTCRDYRDGGRNNR
jgi:hypothetical protein